MSNIVSSSDALTPEWLTGVLREAGALEDGTTVTSAELEPVGSGVMARAQRATLSYSQATSAPASVVVKYQTDDAGSFGVANAMRMYETEVAFYRDVAPATTASIPRCFAAAHDAGSGGFTLVLEDLATTTRPGDVLTMLRPDEASAVLKELVGLQAPTWNNPELLNLPWLADTSMTIGLFDQFPLGVDAFLERFQDKLDDEHLRLFASVLPQSGAWARSWSAPTVIQHGDFRTDNIMFGKTESDPPVTIIDFQTVRLGPPGVDVAYFLGASLSVEDRRTHDEALLREYHDGLLTAGVEDFDFDACWQSYREGALYGVCLFVGMAGQVESTERADRLIAEQVSRYASMAIDLESASAASLA